MWTFNNIRRTLMMILGFVGLAFEIFTPGSRVVLIITDFILIGIVPVEVIVERLFGAKDKMESQGGKHEQ
jgi:hypothetical protein